MRLFEDPTWTRRLLDLATGIYLASFVTVAIVLRSYDLVHLTAWGLYVVVGRLIFIRRSGNLVGLALVCMAAIRSFSAAGLVSAEGLFSSGREETAAWVTLVTVTPFFVLIWLVGAVWLLFPDGRLNSARDRRLLQGSAVVAGALVALTALTDPQSLPETRAYPHPFIDGDLSAGAGVASIFLILPLFFFGYLVAFKLVRRMRRGSVNERRQSLWIAVAVSLNITIVLSNAFIEPLGTDDRAFLLIDAVAAALVPLAVGVAIMRYRLYEIDRIVSRSATYLGLAVVVVALYSAVVVGIPLLLFGGSDDGDPGLVLPIVAAAAVAVVFEPIRARLQQAANRLVYGDRASPHEVLSSVTSSLSANGAGNGTAELARAIARGTGADQAIVRMASGDVLRADAIFPETDVAGIDAVTVDSLPEDDRTTSHPVVHRGELVGSLTIIKPANDLVTPADRSLLADVAAGAGLLLRNIALNSQLEQRAVEVRASRRRLITTQDAERRRLERNLHDGAQQQVVALKVKLAIAKKLAGKEGADDIINHVAAMADETQQAVDALRTVAHGIYPPLLDSDGLEAALGALERTAPIAFEAIAPDLGRHGRQAEQTAYFCVLETIDRARSARADRVRATVTDDDGGLVVHIDIDAGADASEVDLAAVSDRIEAFGGTSIIEDRPGEGVRMINMLVAGDFADDPGPAPETVEAPA